MRRVSESYRDELFSNNSSPQLIRFSRSSENLQTAPRSPGSTTTPTDVPDSSKKHCNHIEESENHSIDTKGHNRGMSDSFDSQRMMDAILSDNDTKDLQHNTTAAGTATDDSLPTLPRYPVAATKNTNCWSETDIAKFSVRGESYFEDKKKIPSAAYLLKARGADLLLFDTNTNNNETTTCNSAEEPATMLLPVEKFLNGQLLKQPTIAIIFRFPWGCMNQYFELPDLYLPFLKQMKNSQQCDNDDAPSLLLQSSAGFSPAQKCLAGWLAASSEEKNASLKLIALVDEGPFLVRQLVTGRPVLIGTKLALTYQLMDNVLLCELNIGSGSATAKRIVSVCRRYMNALTVDLGWLIQADTVGHLPETMLGSVRLHHPDALKAPKLIKPATTTATTASHDDSK